MKIEFILGLKLTERMFFFYIKKLLFPVSSTISRVTPTSSDQRIDMDYEHEQEQENENDEEVIVDNIDDDCTKRLKIEKHDEKNR